MLTVSSTQCGKTFALACWLLAKAWRANPVHVWWWVAPTYNQIVQGWRLMQAIAGSAGIVKSAVSTPYPVLTLINGVSIEFRSWEREQNLMGSTVAGLVVDEAGLLTPEAQSAISSRRSATLGPVRYIGNPGLVSGPFRRLCALAEGDKTGTYSLHKWTWRDKHDALPPARREEYAAFIEQERASLPEYEFRRLYEAEWTSDEASVFRNLDASIDRSGFPPLLAKDDRFAIGVDVAQSVDYLAAVSYGPVMKRFELRYRRRGIAYAQAARELKDISDALQAELIVEDNGPGIALIQELQRLHARVRAFTTTAQSKQEIILNLAADIQEGRCSIADQAPMPYEFSIFRYERGSTGLYRYSAPQGEHDDTVMACALARWGSLRMGIRRELVGWA